METTFPFNPKPSTLMHVDLNSCFASIEQLADPLLRGRPVAVAAYTTPSGCIVAPSVEAKRLGIKTGMRVKDGMLLCRDLVVLAPDPPKYRAVHLQFKRLLGEYTDQLNARSIDEFELDFEGMPGMLQGLHEVAREIKRRIRAEVGESLTVSIGIAPNRFLAKTAAGMKKPDGLHEINARNFREVYARLTLMDLCGIKKNNCVRLNRHGIFTLLDFYDASAQRLHAAFESINGWHWYLRLRGWEPDDVLFGRHSYGNSYALPKPLTTVEELAPLLIKLVVKTGERLRRGGYACRGVHVALMYRDGTHWHHGVSLTRALFDSRDLYKLAFEIMCASPYRKPVGILAESVFGLEKQTAVQASLFDDEERKRRLTDTIDRANERWGDFTITPALMLGLHGQVIDRISFGSIKEIEEQVLA